VKKVLVSAVAVLITAGMSAIARTAPAPAPTAQDAAKVAAGKKAFDAQKCGTCHKVAGKGGTMASSLDGVGKKLSEADLKKWLTAPAEMEAKLPTKPKMSMAAAMKSKKLTDADIDALVAYMSSLK
jgi:mono/diheme cytochrome c family protein